ncbi:MAG TPA: ABC transporter substrate-binding protein [Trebonia sp.]|nr:ABC transporter substrate-binding protein [Trebonia sp.]
MKILRSMAVGAALASVALLAACSGNGTSSTGGSTSTSTSTGGSTSASSGTDSPLKVMVMSADQNSVYEFPTIWTMAEDFAKMQNAAGGVNGHPIQVITCNDQADPNKAVSCAREAVADKVTALVGGLTLYDDSVFPIIAAAGIPWIGLNPLGSLGYTSPDSYATGASAFTYTAAAYYAGKDCSTVAAVRTEGATDTALLNNFAIPGMADAGKKFTTVVTVGITQSDLSGPAAQVSSAQCLYMQLPPQLSEAMVKALQANGSYPHIFSITGTFTDDVMNAAPSVTQGATVIAETPPAATSDRWAAARAAIAEYSGAGSVDLANDNVLNTWTAMQIYTDVATAIHGQVTGSALQKQMDATTSVNPETIPPLDFAKPFSVSAYARLFNHNVVILQVDNGKFTATTGYVDMAPIFLEGAGA